MPGAQKMVSHDGFILTSRYIYTAFSWILEWLGSETVKRILSIQRQGYKLGIDCHTNKLWICIYFHSVCLKTHSMDLKGSSKSLETVATKQSKPVWYIQRLIHQLKAELSTWQTSSKYLLNELMIQHAEIPNFTYLLLTASTFVLFLIGPHPRVLQNTCSTSTSWLKWMKK